MELHEAIKKNLPKKWVSAPKRSAKWENGNSMPEVTLLVSLTATY